jgi:hypothetical protein
VLTAVALIPRRLTVRAYRLRDRFAKRFQYGFQRPAYRARSRKAGSPLSRPIIPKHFAARVILIRFIIIPPRAFSGRRKILRASARPVYVNTL